MVHFTESRRSFLKSAAVGAAALALPVGAGRAAANKPVLEVGEGVVDTTPPVGIELGGFHRPPGQERRIAGIRRPTAARALVLRLGDTQAAIVSIDIATVVDEMTVRVQQRIAGATGHSSRQCPALCHAHAFDARVLLLATMGCVVSRVHGDGGRESRSRRSNWLRPIWRLRRSASARAGRRGPATIAR